MAKRALNQPGKKGKKKRCSEVVDGITVTVPSKIALDPRMPSWKVTEFPAAIARIYSWNVNGLRSVMSKKELQNFLKNEDPDVLCLNETKITEEKLDQKIISDLSKEKYLHFWNCCKVSGGYAGTAIFSKVRPIDVAFDLGIPKHDQEGRTITLEYDRFILVACYVPNAGQKLDRLAYRTKEWDLDFRNYLKGLETKKNKCVILCGDLNVAHHEIDINNPKGNTKSAGFTPQERQEFTNLLQIGFVDSFRELHPKEVKYTYWNMRSKAREQNKGWRLDYFVVTRALMTAVTESDTIPHVMGSDHCPIKLGLALSKIVRPYAAVVEEKSKVVEKVEKGDVKEEKKVIEEKKELVVEDIKKEVKDKEIETEVSKVENVASPPKEQKPVNPAA